jgi:hypothetical protein
VILFDSAPAGLHRYAEALRDGGYFVEEASEWSQLGKLLELRPHLVLIDLESTRLLRRSDVFQGTFTFPFESFPPIVGIGQRDHGAMMGLAAVLPKPVGVHALLDVVEEVVRTEQARRDSGRVRYA